MKAFIQVAALVLFVVSCTTPQPKQVKVTKLPTEPPPMPAETAPLKRALKAPLAAPSVHQIALTIQYPWSEPNPITLEIWHSTSPISKPGGPGWSVYYTVTNGAPWTYPVRLPATNDMEWFQVRGRDPLTGWIGAWGEVIH